MKKIKNKIKAEYPKLIVYFKFNYSYVKNKTVKDYILKIKINAFFRLNTRYSDSYMGHGAQRSP